MWIDVSVPLDSPHPAWPTSPGVQITNHSDFSTGSTLDTQLTMDVHSGTHVETYAHVDVNGPTLQALAPDQLCGRVVVLDATGETEVPESVLPENVEGLDGIITRTDNSERALMRKAVFSPDFVGWSVDLAEAAGRLGQFKFVGVDYLSIQPFGGDPRVHSAILESGIAIVEGLDLTHVASGTYDMLGLFLPLPSREAAPARVLLKPLDAFEGKRVA